MERIQKLAVEVSERLKHMKQLAQVRNLPELAAAMGGVELMIRRLDLEDNDEEQRRGIAYAMGALAGACAALGMTAPSFHEETRQFHVLPDGKAFPVSAL